MILLLLAACRSDPTALPLSQQAADSGSEPACEPADLDWGEPTTSLSSRRVVDPPLSTPLELNPAFAEGEAAAQALGLGGWTDTPGDPYLLRDELSPGSPAAQEGQSIAFFMHQSDAQIADAESPTRYAALDAPGALQSALRPQELYGLHVLDAAIRTANGLHRSASIDFALATGDNADSTQSNELYWFDAVWNGEPLRPDSGDRDAQIDLDCNDPLADFLPVGADFPWYAVAGNHDVLVQGNFLPAAYEDEVLGALAVGGTRDLALPGGPLSYSAIADSRRALMSRSDIAAIQLDGPTTPGPVGHGLTDDNIVEDSVTWVSRPVPGQPLLLIALDPNPAGPGDAVLPAAQRDDFLEPLLSAADEAGDLVILTSHYALGSLLVDDGAPLLDTLLSHPSVVLSVVGHTHRDSIDAWGEPGSPGAFWEIHTASTADWPQHFRLIELVAHSNGTLSIWTTLVEPLAPEGSMVRRALHLSAVDYQAGWRSNDGTGDVGARNTELIQALPPAFGMGSSTPIRSLLLP